jgi:predicted ArsR family transcriptional regulator
MSLEKTDGPPPRVLDNPLAIRALAHPIRIRLHEIVGRDGPVTAAAAARQLGISQALASHHLRQLAKYGFVEPAPPGDGRARPWRVTATSQSWKGIDDVPDGPATGELLERLLAERALANLAAWHRRRRDAPRQVREASGVKLSVLYLTPAEIEKLDADIEALLRPLVARRRLGDVAARPPGALPFDVTIVAVPLDPTPSGG